MVNKIHVSYFEDEVFVVLTNTTKKKKKLQKRG